MVTQTIAAEGNGIWKEYAGGYEDWLRCRKEATVAEKAATTRPVEARPTQKLAMSKLSWKEQRELEGLPDRIAALETEQGQLTARLGNPELHARQPAEAAEVASRLGSIETELLTLLERWETLESRTSP